MWPEVYVTKSLWKSPILIFVPHETSQTVWCSDCSGRFCPQSSYIAKT